MTSQLSLGEVEVLGRIADASNGTLFVHIHHEGVTIPAVYKPVAGERPLRDFPRHTLARREVAAYRLSAVTGLDVVPDTVLRDGPAGLGSVQRWVGPGPTDQGMVDRELGAGVVDLVGLDAVPAGWFAVFDGEDRLGRPIVLCHADDPRLAAMAVFDVVANNADRKGGHVLADVDGRLLGIDHGLTFHDEPKLRTVLWGWAGELVPQPLLDSVRRIVDDQAAVTAALGDLVSAAELTALVRRAERLLRSGRFPQPRGWPTIPWPPF